MAFARIDTSDAYRAGEIAGAASGDRQNPYPARSVAGRAWLRGYNATFSVPSANLPRSQSERAQSERVRQQILANLRG